MISRKASLALSVCLVSSQGLAFRLLSLPRRSLTTRWSWEGDSDLNAVSRRGGSHSVDRGGRSGRGSRNGRSPAFPARQRSEEFEARRAASKGFEFLYGHSSVLNALIANRRSSFLELLVQDRSNSPSSSPSSTDLGHIIGLAEKASIPVTYLSKHDLNMLSDNRPHQGVILTAAPVSLSFLSDLAPSETKERSPVWLALDEVVDPQNLGALIRSASFLGAEGVVVCAKNSAAPSPVVSRASAGALEFAPLFATRSMPRFLAASAENGWRVVGTTLGEGSIPLRQLEVGLPTILVLGNEGHGLRPMVQRACSTLVNIDGGPSSNIPGLRGGVDSLNVAVSGGIIIHHLLIQPAA